MQVPVVLGRELFRRRLAGRWQAGGHVLEPDDKVRSRIA